MNGRLIRPLSGLISLSLAACFAYAAAPNDAELLDRAAALNQRILNVDQHVDVLVASTPQQYYAPGHTSRADLDKLRFGSVDVMALAIAVGPGPGTPEGDSQARAEAAEKLAAIKSFVKDNPEQVGLALTAADVEKFHGQGKVAVVASFLNARSIGKDIDAVDRLYADGVRLLGLTHAGNNEFADSSRPQQGEPAKRHNGLSALGKQSVAKLNRLGIIIDVSQLTTDGLLQTLELTKAPVIATHSAVRSLVENPRNLSDRELDAIKVNGGVVGIPAFNAYLAPPPSAVQTEQIKALRGEFGLQREFSAAAGFAEGVQSLVDDRRTAFNERLAILRPQATVATYVDHIDYIVKRIGIDHVGVGTDFNHGSGITGFNDESEAINVTAELLRRGYTEAQIAKIWGGNFLRVFRRVEVVSKGLGSPANN